MLSTPDFREKQIILALLSHGDKLSFKNDNIIITDENKKIKHQSTCYRLFSLFVVGHLSITTGLIQRAKKFGFSIVFMNHSLKPYAYWNASAEGNVLLRKKQYQYNSLDIAIRLVHNKIHNQIQALQKIRDKKSELKQTISSLKKYKEKLSTEEMKLHELLGLEGVASKIYFQGLFKDFRWIARRPRA
ncbi:MAG: CRISPR-associated endonuclease Cas1, partial [Bdellovibrionaceae bacterium]|nr:CRISPR-associated endonuclease Cas1 [Pseudobdellovibrionaceae bacterium]